jgi:hypothetical protein
LFIAATLGGVLLTRRARYGGAVVVLACSAVFDLLFLVVGTLPATVPVAVALLILEVRARRATSGARALGHHGSFVSGGGP